MAAGITNARRSFQYLGNGTIGLVTSADFSLSPQFRIIDFIFYSFTCTTNGADVLCRLSDDGGATFKSGGTDYLYTCYNVASDTASNTFASSNSNGDSKIIIAKNLTQSRTSPSARFAVRVMGHSDAGATSIYADGIGNQENAGPPSAVIKSAGTRNAAESHNAIRFLMSSGNLFLSYSIVGYR